MPWPIIQTDVLLTTLSGASGLGFGLVSTMTTTV